jgi:hypothetical protein
MKGATGMRIDFVKTSVLETVWRLIGSGMRSAGPAMCAGWRFLVAVVTLIVTDGRRNRLPHHGQRRSRRIGVTLEKIFPRFRRCWL